MSLNNYWPSPWVGSYIDPWDVTGSYLTPLPYDRNARYAFDKWMKEKGEKHKMADKDKILKIKCVIFNGDATIVFWNDGEKTVVKRSEGECDDREKAILTAFAIKTLGGKPELNKMMRKAFKDKEPKRYRWTDICKIRFYELEKDDNNRLVPFMLDIEKTFDQFGYLSMMKLRELAEKHDIFKNGHEPFEMCKFELKHADKEMLVWKNRDDFGLVREADLKKNKWYYHIYIRRSPEPKPYPDDGKGEEE